MKLAFQPKRMEKGSSPKNTNALILHYSEITNNNNGGAIDQLGQELNLLRQIDKIY